MKKYALVMCIVIALLLCVQRTEANDGGPNTVFWIKDTKSTCVSVVDLRNLPTDHFLLFDYAPSLGEQMGKPWTIVEEGKCYEVSEKGGDVYRVRIVQGDEKSNLTNYTQYRPTDDIETKDGEVPSNIEHIWPYRDTIGVSPADEIHFTGIHAHDLFPTKYDFGVPVTSFISYMTDEQREIAADANYLEIDRIYSSLATELETAIRTCDSRKRVERRFRVTGSAYVSEHGVIWRLSNNTDYQLPEPIDPLRAIEAMGCREAVAAFMNEHKDDFKTIDTLAGKVLLKYPNALEISDRYGPIFVRNNIFNIGGDSNQNPPHRNDEETQATPPDEPTSEQKFDQLTGSKNPLMRIYVILPFAALIGMAVFLIRKKRKTDVY